MKTALVIKHAGQEVPEEWMKAFLHKFGPACVGLAAPVDNDGNIEVMTEFWPDLKELGEYQNVMKKLLPLTNEEMKEFQLFMAFSDDPGQVTVSTTEDNTVECPQVPPFILLSDDKDLPKLVGVVSGEFEGFPDDVHLHHTVMMEEILPKVQQIARLTGGDLDKIMEELRSPAFMRDMNRLSKGDSGLIYFIAANGDALPIFKKDSVLGTLPWGASSFLIESFLIEPASKSVVTAAKGLAGRVAAMGKRITEAAQPVAEAGKREPVIAASTHTDTSTGIIKVKVKCPFSQGTKNEKREWYQKFCGAVPEGYKNCPTVEVDQKYYQAAMKAAGKDVDTKDIKQLDKIVASASPTKAKNADAPAPKTDIKVTNTKTGGPTIPIIGAGEKDDFLKDAAILQVLDKSSSVISPMTIGEDEEKYPSFFEQTGKNVEDFMYLSYDQLIQFTAKYPSLGNVMLMTMLAREAKRAQEKGAETPVTIPEPTVADTKPATTTGRIRPSMPVRKAG